MSRIIKGSDDLSVGEMSRCIDVALIYAEHSKYFVEEATVLDAAQTRRFLDAVFDNWDSTVGDARPGFPFKGTRLWFTLPRRVSDAWALSTSTYALPLSPEEH